MHPGKTLTGADCTIWATLFSFGLHQIHMSTNSLITKLQYAIVE